MNEFTETDDGRVEATGKNAPVNGDSDLEVIGAEEAFFVQRDESGDLVPKVLEVPGTDGKAVRVRPASSGVYNEYLSPVPWEDDEQMAQLFSRQYPDLDVSAHDLENDLLSFGAQTMVQLIREASGEEMQSALEEKQQRKNIEEMMQMLGIDRGDADMGDLMTLMSEMGDGGVTGEQLDATADALDMDPETTPVAELSVAVGEGGETAAAPEGSAGPNTPNV